MWLGSQYTRFVNVDRNRSTPGDEWLTWTSPIILDVVEVYDDDDDDDQHCWIPATMYGGGLI